MRAVGHVGVALAGQPPERVGRADPGVHLLGDRGVRADVRPERAEGRAGDRLGALDEHGVVAVVPAVDEEAVVAQVGVQFRVAEPLAHRGLIPGDRAAVPCRLVHPADDGDHRARVVRAPRAAARDGRERPAGGRGGRQRVAKRARGDHRGLPRAREFPAQRPVDGHGRRVEDGKRVAAPGHLRPAGPPSAAGRCPGPALPAPPPRWPPRPSAPPGRATTAACRGTWPCRPAAAGEGAQARALRERGGRRSAASGRARRGP